MRTKALGHLDQFLDDYPGMSTAPHSHSGVCLRGKFSFRAAVYCGAEIEDNYKLKIVIAEKFPQAIPVVEEIGGKIPRNGDFHVNPDGSICLGSPLRLLKMIHNFPSLSNFANKCLVPYLYAVSYKLRNGGDFVLGELAHGDQGIVDDYSMVLGLAARSQIKQAIQLLGVKKRIANKKTCPCGCGKRLGACPFHRKLNNFRRMAPVSWFKAHVNIHEREPSGAHNNP
jgi:hypothetical protein